LKAPGSLLSRLTWWFAGSLLALYGISATLVYLYASAQQRQYAVLTLKTEAEAVASYVADSGALDAPELAAPERDPIPMWLRVRRDGHVLAQTPGTPAVAVAATNLLEPEERGEVVSVFSLKTKPSYMLVRHRVGGKRTDTYVEAIGAMAPLVHARQRLGSGLFLVGLVVIPLSAFGGRALAQRALRPLQDLVVDIRRIDPGGIEGQRLPEGGVEEVAVLSRAFNGLLGRLEENVERMRRFTADASHEIRNPLSVLRTGLEIALRRERPAAEYQELMRENLQEIERLHTIVEGILLLARGVPGQEIRISRSPLDLSALVRATAGFFSAYAAERGLRIEVEAETGLTVEGDAALLRLVVFNLLDNALKHSPDGETVRVEVRGGESSVAIVVADRGPGVRPEDRERVFERFFRGGPASGSGVGGIGLSVVRWIAEAHGGSARLLDTERGAAFEVELPR
jgi:heavy metal sensor kinase